MVSLNFDEMFAPTLSKLNLEQRPQQRHLGWAVVDSIATETHLVGEARTGTGKSFAYLVPAIHAKKNGDKRTVVSTETTALQDQLTKKDLPLLHQIYGGFKYRSLKGRSWYFCYNRARMNSRGTQRIADLAAALSKHASGGLGDGERADCEKRLGYEISSDDWALISGATDFCSDNGCKPEVCFSARARDLALDADIVVTNHAMLRTDADMRESDMSVLGDYDVLVVDEAHTLEGVLVDGWTMTTSPWEVSQAEADIIEGMQKSQIVVAPNMALEEELARAFESFELAMLNITRFFKQRAIASSGGRPVNWSRENFPLSEVYLSGVPDAKMIEYMTEYETTTPQRIRTLRETLDKAYDYLKIAAEDMLDQKVTGIRKVRKGQRAAKEMKELLELIEKALPTRDGIIMHFGVPYGVIVEGYVSRKREEGVRLKVVPIDISGRAARTIWPDRTCILLSATLTDPTDGTFTYAANSLGMVDYRTVTVDSPFTYATQQLVYVTPATADVVDVAGARYALDELVEVVHASNGRTLILFTARAELDHAYEELTDLQKRGKFPYPIHYQDKATPKQKLVDAFKSEEHSVLLATKSFFTGVDFPGATCTTVAICKFPLPQYNTLCKQQITWWRGRGFPRWYERESLLIFAQAAGRLIRSESDHGVVALLDQRCANPKENVYKTAQIGIAATGSNVTQSLDDVRLFLGSKAVPA
jgi:Rad3-related DNA helicase